MAELGGSAGPLAGVKVLDFTRVLSGPFATMVLADLGADVVKVEHPDGGDETRTVVRYDSREDDEDYFFVANRNKRSITLDLKRQEDHDTVLQLVDAADVVVENFSSGVMDRLGLDADTLLARNPGLVFCSISGFGPVGPYAEYKSYDSIIQALSGVMSITGTSDGEPVRAGIMVGDLAGALYSVIAIVSALRERDRTGLGQVVHIPLLDSLVSLLTVNAAEFLANGRIPAACGSENPNRSPSGAYRTGDGRYLQILAATPRLWEAFADASGLGELRVDERFASHQDRLDNRAELATIIEDRLGTAPAAHWVEVFNGAGVPCGLVKDLQEVFDDPHVKFSGLVRTLEHPRSGVIKQLASPMRFSRGRQEVDRPPPLLGEHSEEIVADWLSDQDAPMAGGSR